MKHFTSVFERAIEHLNRLEALGPLLARLSLGGMFLSTGWGKLHALDRVADFFRELGIIAPSFNAHLVATTEFTGGIALLLGLATRLASIPLAIVMTVAILTARLSDVDGVLGFLSLDEFTYLAVLVWLAVAGAGAVSLDAWIGRRRAKRHRDGHAHGSEIAAED